MGFMDVKNRIMAEGIFPFYLDQAYVKGRLVRLGPEIDKLLSKHQNYPPLVKSYMAELTVLAAVLSTDVKYRGVFTLQISARPDQPSMMKLMVIDVNTEGHIRAYARWDKEEYKKLSRNDSLSLQEVFGHGFITFTADLAAHEERYQAIVELSGKTLADCIHHFFRQSEQIPTGIVLYSDYCDQNHQTKAGALILQQLPVERNISYEAQQKHEDDWITDLSLLGTLTQKELLDFNLTSAKLLHRLFHERNLYQLDPQSLLAKCSCSQEKIYNLLKTFSAHERTEITIENQINVKCEFCGHHYTFIDNKDFSSF